MARDELARLRDLQARCEADFRAIAAQYPELCTAVAHRRFEDYVCQQNDTQGGYMPAKGYRTMGEELENVAIRLPISVVAQVDAHIETLRKAAPWAKVGRSDALRDLVVRGLDSLSQPQPAPTAMPAIPSAMEPAPDAPPAPVQPSSAPPGLQHCTVNATHPPYKLTLTECPMCATNRRTRASKARKKEQAQTPQ
jgi:hypothetical protein